MVNKIVQDETSDCVLIHIRPLPRAKDVNWAEFGFGRRLIGSLLVNMERFNYRMNEYD